MRRGGKKFERLVGIVAQLRGKDGCPWDRRQTAASLLPYLLEEAHEVIEAVEGKNWPHLREELGDLMLHVLFQAAIAEERGRFHLEDLIGQVTEKLVRRHPHVFGETRARTSFHAKQNWEAAKHKEKGRKSRLEGIPKSLPALVRAQRLQEKAAYAGFDWKSEGPVWRKVREELRELGDARSDGRKASVEEEMGDLLFALVNLSRFLGISSEGALRKASAKFTRRFGEIESALARQGRTPEESTLQEMDALWEQHKRAKRSRRK